ncbi:MAG: tRNA uridine-5-carboxymethylaminomethyl(34) synthesis enzyme MnmG, partial [Litorivicinaceae bacterium]
ALGLVGDTLWKIFNDRQEHIDKEMTRLKSTWVRPTDPCIAKLNQVLTAPLSKESTAHDLLKRPEIHYQDLVELADIEGHGDSSIASQVEILVKYAGYINRQADEIKKLNKNEQARLPTDIDYSKIVGLSNEVRQKLLDHRPETIAQASRISGVTPAALSLLLVHLKKLELAHLAS